MEVVNRESEFHTNTIEANYQFFKEIYHQPIREIIYEYLHNRTVFVVEKWRRRKN